MMATGATEFHVRERKVRRLVVYRGYERAAAGLGLAA
jgi:hypothetical protein